MKILAFLQNQWFKDPERVKQIIANALIDNPDAREFYIKTFLFWGCVTGKRLRKELGEDYCDDIIWEEISPEIGGYSSSKFPPDYLHIVKVIEKHKPTHIIAFGKIAENAIMNLYHNDKIPDKVILIAPHPAARQVTVVIEQLRTLRKLLDEERQYDEMVSTIV